MAQMEKTMSYPTPVLSDDNHDKPLTKEQLDPATSDQDDDHGAVPATEPADPSAEASAEPLTTVPSTASGPVYLTGIKLFTVMASMTVAIFLMLLDTSIVGTATPHITNEFHSLQDVGWYGAAYQLGSAPLQPLCGIIYHKFRLKWAFLSFFALFELGSVLCGAAQSSSMLIVGRAVAGMGASGLVTGALVILVASAPLHRRAPLTGMLMGVSQLGVAFGPLIGGALTEYASWRWCFYINLPIGAVFAGVLAFIHISEQVPKPKFSSALSSLPRELDWVGFVLLASAAIELLLALEYGGNAYPWQSSMVIGLFCGAGVTFLVWLVWDYRRGDKALIPLGLAGRRTVWSASLTQALIFTTLFLIAYFLPIYFQAVKGATPFRSGVNVLPVILGQLLFAVLTGFAVSRTGYLVPYLLIGTTLGSVGTGLFALFSPSTSTGEWIGFEIISGVGRGFGMQMSMLAIQAVVEPAKVPIALSLLMFTQSLVGAISLSVGNTIFDAVLRYQLPIQAPRVDPAAIIQAGATGFRNIVGAQDLDGVILAYNASCRAVFILAAAASAAAFFTSPLIGRVNVSKKKGSKPKTQGNASQV